MSWRSCCTRGRPFVTWHFRPWFPQWVCMGRMECLEAKQTTTKLCVFEKQSLNKLWWSMECRERTSTKWRYKDCRFVSHIDGKWICLMEDGEKACVLHAEEHPTAPKAKRKGSPAIWSFWLLWAGLTSYPIGEPPMNQSESGHSSRCLLPENRAKNRERGTEFSGLLSVSNTIWKYLMVEKAFFGIRNAIDRAKQRLVIQMSRPWYKQKPKTRATKKASLSPIHQILMLLNYHFFIT